MPNIEDIRASWSALKEEFEPKIRDAKAEVEEARAELAASRERHSAAASHHKKLVDQFNDRWSAAAKTGGA